MSPINDLVSLPVLVDAVIAFTLLEGLLLAAHHRVTGKGVGLRDFGINMLSGLCLMLALRAGLRDQGAGWVSLFLLFAGVAHGADIVLRWRRKSEPTGRGTGLSQARRKVAEVNMASRAEVRS